MSILQFFRIIWARRWVILASIVIAVVAGTTAAFVLPPRYSAESRVMLDIIKPDPVTGQVMSSPFLRAYTTTQTQLIQDIEVASRVVKAIGWEEDPEQLKQYAARNRSDDRDFVRWAAQQIIDGTQAQVIEGSNIIVIRYSSEKPELAKKVADALREAYMTSSLEDRQESARRNANWYDQQAAKSREALGKAEAEKAAYERQNGVLLQDNKTDVDSARLAALASQGGSSIVTTGSSGESSTSLQLAQVEAAIAQASKVLGPNHPDLLDMRRRRELLEREVEKERTAQSASTAAAMSAARATSGMLEQQKSKVMAQREKVEQLRLLQDNVDLRREQYNKSAARAAELRQEADVADAGITPLGSAVTPQSAEFPNKPLFLFGGFGGGAALGVGLALLLELLGRRVRSAEDLEAVVDAPVLAIIHRPAQPGRRRPARALGDREARSPKPPRRAARA